jgi:hypothetical protein
LHAEDQPSGLLGLGGPEEVGPVQVRQILVGADPVFGGRDVLDPDREDPWLVRCHFQYSSIASRISSRIEDLCFDSLACENKGMNASASS